MTAGDLGYGPVPSADRLRDVFVARCRERYGWQVRLTRALQRWWWGRCSRIICCSEFLRGILVDHYGVDPETHQVAFADEAGTGQGGELIATPTLADIVGDDRPEIVVGARFEGARTLADVLRRRTRIAFDSTDRGRGAAPRAAQLLASELGWDRARQDGEVEQWIAAIDRELATEGL